MTAVGWEERLLLTQPGSLHDMCLLTRALVVAYCPILQPCDGLGHLFFIPVDLNPFNA